MQLSRAVRSLRTLSRPQRAFSAAPQPVYEPHVVCTSVQIKPGRRCRDQIESRPPTLREERPDISKPLATPPPRRQNSSTLSDAAAATPEQLDAAAATPE